MWGWAVGENAFLSYSCRAPGGEAERNTEGRVIRRLSGWGWEEGRAAEGGKKVLPNSPDGHQPDVETIWRRWSGGGGGGREENQMRGGWLRRASEAGREGSSPNWPIPRCHQRSGTCSS